MPDNPITTETYFKELFPDQVHQEYQRKQAKIRPWVHTMVSEGDTLNLPFIGSVGMNTKARHGQITVAQPEEGRIPVVVSDFYSAIQYDDMDQSKTSIQLNAQYVPTTVYAAYRKTDLIITTAMDLGSSASLTTKQTMADDNDIIDTVTAIRENDVDEDTLYGLMSPVGYAQMLKSNANIITFDSNDEKPLVGHPNMFKWQGVNWMVHNGLPFDGVDERTGFIWAKEAVVLAINEEIKTKTSWLPKEHGWLTTTTLSMGAVVRDADACYQFLINEA